MLASRRLPLCSPPPFTMYMFHFILLGYLFNVYAFGWFLHNGSFSSSKGKRAHNPVETPPRLPITHTPQIIQTPLNKHLYTITTYNILTHRQCHYCLRSGYHKQPAKTVPPAISAVRPTTPCPHTGTVPPAPAVLSIVASTFDGVHRPPSSAA